jgi:hypothetical protein
MTIFYVSSDPFNHKPIRTSNPFSNENSITKTHPDPVPEEQPVGIFSKIKYDAKKILGSVEKEATKVGKEAVEVAKEVKKKAVKVGKKVEKKAVEVGKEVEKNAVEVGKEVATNVKNVVKKVKGDTSGLMTFLPPESSSTDTPNPKNSTHTDTDEEHEYIEQTMGDPKKTNNVISIVETAAEKGINDAKEELKELKKDLEKPCDINGHYTG